MYSDNVSKYCFNEEFIDDDSEYAEYSEDIGSNNIQSLPVAAKKNLNVVAAADSELLDPQVTVADKKDM
jgi:hypothetical protein